MASNSLLLVFQQLIGNGLTNELFNTVIVPGVANPLTGNLNAGTHNITNAGSVFTDHLTSVNNSDPIIIPVDITFSKGGGANLDGLATVALKILTGNGGPIQFDSGIGIDFNGNELTEVGSITTTTFVIGATSLAESDFTAFAAKQNALPNADETHDGILVQADWATFFNKQAALTDLGDVPNVFDTGWTANSGAGDKTAVVPNYSNGLNGTMVAALNVVSGGTGTAISAGFDALALCIKKLQAIETGLAAAVLPNN